MNEVAAALLAQIESGHNIFRPETATAEGRAAFQRLAQQLIDLRAMGLVRFPDTRMALHSNGSYLLVGPCDLTPSGVAALYRDRSLGPRPPNPSAP